MAGFLDVGSVVVGHVDYGYRLCCVCIPGRGNPLSGSGVLDERCASLSWMVDFVANSFFGIRTN